VKHQDAEAEEHCHEEQDVRPEAGPLAPLLRGAHALHERGSARRRNRTFGWFEVGGDGLAKLLLSEQDRQADIVAGLDLQHVLQGGAAVLQGGDEVSRCAPRTFKFLKVRFVEKPGHGAADAVQQARLAVVHVAQDADDGLPDGHRRAQRGGATSRFGARAGSLELAGMSPRT
jgi:hypothetical protein